MFLAVTLLFGGHAAIDPLLRMVLAAQDNRMAGDLVFAMPDGRFCRHMSFNNATSEVTEGGIAPCPDDLARQHFRTSRGFSWGER